MYQFDDDYYDNLNDYFTPGDFDDLLEETVYDDYDDESYWYADDDYYDYF